MNSLKAVHEDIENYKRLCNKYGEKPVKDEYGISPYCDHAKDLKQRERDEAKSKN